MRILESENFDVITPEQPHVSRADGGHLIINPKVVVECEPISRARLPLS